MSLEVDSITEVLPGEEICWEVDCESAISDLLVAADFVEELRRHGTYVLAPICHGAFLVPGNHDVNWTAGNLWIACKSKHGRGWQRVSEGETSATGWKHHHWLSEFTDENQCRAVEPISEDRCDTSDADTYSFAQIDAARRIAGIFRGFQLGWLEDAAESMLSEQLQSVLQTFKGMAVNEIHHLIKNERIKTEVAEIALHVLGDIGDAPTHNHRRWVLQEILLNSRSPIVRDGANVGLSYMDDPDAIPWLKKAIETEELSLLRDVIKKTLGQLEDTEKCRI